MCHGSITVMSLWVRWHLKSPASRLFAQPFVEEQIKETSKLCITRHQWPVDSPHKGPVTQKIFQFDDIIMSICRLPTYVITSKDLNFNQHIFLLSFTRQCRIPRNIICWGKLFGLHRSFFNFVSASTAVKTLIILQKLSSESSRALNRLRLCSQGNGLKLCKELSCNLHAIL